MLGPPVHRPARPRSSSFDETAPGRYEAPTAPRPASGSWLIDARRARERRSPRRSTVRGWRIVDQAMTVAAPLAAGGLLEPRRAPSDRASRSRPSLVREHALRRLHAHSRDGAGGRAGRRQRARNLSAKRVARSLRSRGATMPPTWSTRWSAPAFSAAEFDAGEPRETDEARRPRLAAAPRRRGLRRRQHHAAVGLGVVGRASDMDAPVQRCSTGFRR